MPQLDLSPKPQDHSNLQCRLQVEDRNEALRLKAESETPEARREKQLADPWRNGSCPESDLQAIESDGDGGDRGVGRGEGGTELRQGF